MVPVTQTPSLRLRSKKRAPKHDSSRLEAFFACLHIFNFLYGLFMVPVTRTNASGTLLHLFHYVINDVILQFGILT